MIERHRARGPDLAKKGHFRIRCQTEVLPKINRLEEFYKWILYLDV